jgi:hypothetical protein
MSALFVLSNIGWLPGVGTCGVVSHNEHGVVVSALAAVEADDAAQVALPQRRIHRHHHGAHLCQQPLQLLLLPHQPAQTGTALMFSTIGRIVQNLETSCSTFREYNTAKKYDGYLGIQVQEFIIIIIMLSIPSWHYNYVPTMLSDPAVAALLTAGR